MRKQKFTRTDIQAVMTAAGIDTDQARKLTALIIDTLAAAITAGKPVELRGLGTFGTRERNPRTMHNPQNMNPVDIPARRVIFFRPAGSLKQAVNGES